MKGLLTTGQGGQFRMQSDDTDYMMYFSPVARTGWTITIQCPEAEVYGGVDRMKNSTTTISIFSIILMSLVLILFFRRFRNISIKEAGLEKELDVASGIQSGMLPQALTLPESVKRLDVFGYQKPAKSVGGDLYDYFIENDRLYFCMGDVSGKGVPASLYMVVILALFRNIARKESDPSKIAIELNNALISSNNYSMFCTMFLGVLDMNTWKLEYCNAGHNRPMICRRSEAEVSYKEVLPNVVLGVRHGRQFREMCPRRSQIGHEAHQRSRTE